MKYKILNLSNILILLTAFAGVWVTSALITPNLHYHLQQSAFLTGADFFKTFSNYPGGISDYLGEFIAQFFNFNLIGSILIVAIASLQGFIALKIIKPFLNHTKFNYSIFTLVFVFGILVLCNYFYPYYASIRLLFAFVFIWLFTFLNKRNPGLSPIVWFVFAILLFYISNGFALFVFTLSCVLIFLLTNKQPIRNLYIPAFLIFAGILPYLAYKSAFAMGLGNLYKIVLSRPPEMLQYIPESSIYIYYFLLPTFLFLILLFRNLKKHEPNPFKNGKQKSEKNNLFTKAPLIVTVQVIACLAISFVLFHKYTDPFKKKLLYIEYYAEHEQWKEVLNTAESIRIYDYRVNFQVWRAYSHFGKLPERLFNYPPLLGSQGLFIDFTSAKSATMPTSDLFFDLGFMAESQHWAFEAQTLMPNSPRILKRLILINIVNRKYHLANKFLDLLNKNMLYHHWVQKYNRYIADTTLAETDNLIHEKRLFSPHKEAINNGNLESLKLLFESNHDNRLAYDYLLSYLILDLNFTEFLKYLQYYNHFNLKTLPRSWEETLVFCAARNQTIPENISSKIVTNDCIARFTDFTNKIKPYHNNIQLAKSSVNAVYNKTFWYYLLYLNPNVTKTLEKKKPGNVKKSD